MYHIIQFSEARNNLTRYVNLVEEGQRFIIVRFGHPVAKLTPYQEDKDAPRETAIQE